MHYRPQVYWQAGTQVTVDAKVYGLNLGDGMYGETDRTLNLTSVLRRPRRSTTPPRS